MVQAASGKKHKVSFQKVRKRNRSGNMIEKQQGEKMVVTETEGMMRSLFRVPSRKIN